MLDYPVITPEHVPFNHTLAGLSSRAAAGMLDILLLSALLGLFAVGAAASAPFVGAMGPEAGTLGALLVGSCYWVGSEMVWEGQTPGKRLLHLRVVGESGLPISFSQSVLRNLLRVVDALPAFFGVGLGMMACDPWQRRLGDIVAGTVVVRERRPRPPEVLDTGGVVGQVTATDSSLSAESLARISLTEREFLADLCLRRDLLDDRLRLALFSELAERYIGSLGAVRQEGMSDENLVLGIAGELFRPVGAELGSMIEGPGSVR